ncbi:hypothetical protein BCV72DRAFT_319256 [Rhizopus microsporus var. microsporus]|uniref:Uncharacterized protein n=2 Tax=Rhizopus microsporus TaxID=58291 RepID=A0A2G4SNG6_RHIZD|nr:uncharacterized protein RHIMIDRAFT_299113 [Rhizopus microsporus ATCC 52813]ORE09629.1 hypothetical protein BCV72DRAFT_319256 [Rhizopus microsporus var. microsporus]PHZ10321.1 hypothetical protein RHIMIDRAFT_299113 [Rhizopus microsporus ATCC 52813]
MFLVKRHQAFNATAPKKTASTLVSSLLASPSLASESPFQPKPPPSSDFDSSPFQKLIKLKASIPFSNQMATARTFSACSANHGYMFLYLPLRFRLPIDQLCSRLRQLNINTRRILNIHFSDHHPVALLIHNDYKNELRSQLKKFKIPTG